MKQPDIDNQKQYWNKIAREKEFTHPLNIEFVQKYFDKNGSILDFGCGYGRTVKELRMLGYRNIKGFDTSDKLIERGNTGEQIPIFHIQHASELPVDKESIDTILLFAVLTCIPSNKGQKKLINLLHSKLKAGGHLYLSDYYLQEENGRYTCLNQDKENHGVFILPEGVMFRHHEKNWIKTLLEKFDILEEHSIKVTTMNGHISTGFQMIARKK